MGFAIATQSDQYLTYLLIDEEADSRLEVVPERGGIITRWRYQGNDILYLDAERFANPQLSVRGGIPILFPICGNLPDNTYIYQGQTFTLTQHGFARDLPWEVTRQETANCASLTLVLASSEQTRQVYPFDFQLTFTYQLQGNRLRIQQRYTNQSTQKMPFSTGLHPYFQVKDKTQLTFDIPASAYQDQQTKEVFPFNGALDLEREEIDVAFSSITRHSAGFTDNHRRLQLSLNYSDCYSTLVFWTIKGKNYVCLEPWSAPRNALNTGDNLINLEPAASLETIVEIAVNVLSV